MWKHVPMLIGQAPYACHGHLNVKACTDADWSSSKTDRRSNEGYCMHIGGDLVLWKSKKQLVLTQWSCEAKYRAMAHGSCKLSWIKIVLKELGIKKKGAMMLLFDSISALHIAYSPVHHDSWAYQAYWYWSRLNNREGCRRFNWTILVQRIKW